MGYKYKIKEEGDSRFNVGDVKVNGGVKSKITKIDPQTGAISWDIDYIPDIDKLVEDSMELVLTAKGVYQRAKDDKKFLDIYEQAKNLRNLIRTHVRNHYPDEYRKAMREGDIDETSMSGGAGAYLTPYAFARPKKKKKTEICDLDESAEQPGEDLGPGPTASDDGVKDNAYVKQFKYQLVPKNKQGTYVQKGSTLPVRKLWEKA